MDLLAKLLAALKQKYASLGLGDEVLQARAATLIATGLVTEDNLDAVAVSQKADLENLQKQNDKRVTDALAKERKKHEEEMNRLKEENDRKIQEEIEKIRNGGNPITNPDTALAELKAKMEKDKKEYEAQLKKIKEEASKGNSTSAELIKGLEDQLKTLSESYTSLKGEYDAEKAANAKAERNAKILETAKSLGVPQWRIDEGFVIADDATDEAISEQLSKVANNIKTNSLPGGMGGFPLQGNDVTKEEAAELAKSLVK